MSSQSPFINLKESFALMQFFFFVLFFCIFEACTMIYNKFPNATKVKLFSLRLQSHTHTHTHTHTKKKHRCNPSSNCLVVWTVSCCATSDAYAGRKLLYNAVMSSVWNTAFCRVFRFPLFQPEQQMHRQDREDVKKKKATTRAFCGFYGRRWNRGVSPALTQLWKCFISPICATGSVSQQPE